MDDLQFIRKEEVIGKCNLVQMELLKEFTLLINNVITKEYKGDGSMIVYPPKGLFKSHITRVIKDLNAAGWDATYQEEKGRFSGDQGSWIVII